MQKRSTQIWYSLAFLLAFSFFGQPTASAQRTEINDGREFYFGIPHCRKPAGESARGAAPVQLWISSKVKAKVTIKAEGVGLNMPGINVIPNEVKVIALPDNLMNKESEMIKNYGISVSSDAPISLTVFLSYKVSGEAFKVMPVEALGRKYYALSMYQDKTDDFKPGQILIVATADNTAVTYHPKAATNRVAAGGSKTVILKKGDTYLIESKIQPGLNQDKATDLSGTYIEASKPIAVYSGHTKGAFPRYQPTMLGTPANFMRNMMFDAMWPVEFLGKEYVSAPIKYNNRPYTANDGEEKGDLIRFVATQNGTIIQQMRMDGSGLKTISMVLSKGQYFDITSQDIAAYYKANYPVLVGHYGKAWRSSAVTIPNKGNNDEVLNPSRNGEGMLMTLTPMEQWGSYAVFRSIEEIDNFTLVIFKSNEVDSIRFDDKPLRVEFNGILKVEGTPYSYARKQISAGAHNFTATSSKIKFAAYAYGNYDNTKDGFAYGYPTSVNYAISCEDSLKVTVDPVCGDYTGLAKALPSNAECAAIYNAYMIAEQSYNYTFELTSVIEPGIKQLGFTVNVIDKTQDAKAVIKVINRSGLDTTLELTYIAQKIKASPEVVDFKALAPNETKCQMITLTNTGTVDAVINNLSMKGNGANFTIDKSALPLTLKPGESKEVEVCATALTSVVLKADSLIADLECYRKPIALLKYATSEADLHIGDAHFNSVLIGYSATLPVVMKNQGKTTVEVYSVDIPAGLPFTTQNLLDKFPIVLKAGETHTFNVTYTPVRNAAGDPESNMNDKSFTAIFKANTEDSKVTSLWDGYGIDVLPLGQDMDWQDQRVIDDYVKNKMGITEWPGTVTFNAEKVNTTLTLKDIKITENPDNIFRIDQNAVSAIIASGKTLNPENPTDFISIPVFFAPNKVGPFSGKVTLFGTTVDSHNNLEERTFTVDLTGIGVQPNYDPKDKDYGIVDINTPTPGMVRVYGTGSGSEVKIFKMTVVGPDAANFKIDPSYFNGGQDITEFAPVNILEGEFIDIPVIFTAPTAKQHNAQIVYETDAPAEKVSNLTGMAMSGDIGTTPYAFVATYITQTNTNGTVECINKGGDVINVTAVAFDGGADDQFFAITGYRLQNAGTTFTTLPIVIPAGDALVVSVSFTPDAVRNDYVTKVKYTTSLGEVYSDITGIGKIMTSLVKIDRNYTTTVDGEVSIAVDLQGAPEVITDGNITSFKTTINFDKNVIQPREGADNIKLREMTDGWEVVSAEITDRINGTFEVVLKTDDASKALKEQGSLFEFIAQGFLAKETTSELPVQMTEFNRPWVVINNSPGLVTVDPVCGGDLRKIAISNQQYQLMVPAPNPVTGNEVKIQYSIALDAATELVLMNSNGERIATLVNANLKSGVYEVTVDVSALASGTYYYSIQSGPFAKVQPLILSK